MRLEKIITLANKKTELRALAMIRSLRATGCKLPVLVIPYDDKKFDLPENCMWWEIPELFDWLRGHRTINIMRKYQCLLTENYQYADADVIFLRNPETVLQNLSGWISSCGHWHNPQQTYTDETVDYYRMKSTTWQKNVFNAGQFACDEQLYDFEKLKAVTENPSYAPSVLNFLYGEQVGYNLLVYLAGIPVTNVTLPPIHMESTWAGDYGDDYRKTWTSPSLVPYLIHWAGCKMNAGRPIDELFFQWLSFEEKIRWDSEISRQNRLENKWNKKLYRNLRLIKNTLMGMKFE